MIELRPIPYPYRAMLAICSDLDETPDRQTYWESMRFLNGAEQTRMGVGVDLEVANTIYFDMPPTQFAYWNTDDAGRHMVRTLIRSGHVDGLHSYGDCATTRAHAERALVELERHDCRLKVWIDHSIAPSNFGADIMRGGGDIPGHPAYHADLACEFGIRYVWRGRMTSVIGQDSSSSIRGLFNARRPLRSSRTIAKELVKSKLAQLGNTKYAMHATNQLLHRSQLRDGRPVYEFIRCNPFWGGVGLSATADGLAHVLTAKMLDRLVRRGGTCILYTHLGKISGADAPFSAATRAALEHLAEEYRAGRILVTATSRLLDYRRTFEAISLCTRDDATGTRIDLKTGGEPGVEQPADLSGLTLYVPEPRRTRLAVDGVPVAVKQNPPDHRGRASIMLPWPRLELPCL